MTGTTTVETLFSITRFFNTSCLQAFDLKSFKQLMGGDVQIYKKESKFFSTLLERIDYCMDRGMHIYSSRINICGGRLKSTKICKMIQYMLEEKFCLEQQQNGFS